MSTKRSATKQPKPKRKSGVKNDTGVREVSAKHPDAHHGRPVRNCICLCCLLHRVLDEQAERDAALAAAYDDAFAVPGTMTVIVGKNATEGLRRALGAK